MECCIKCKCSYFKTDGLKTGDEQEKGHKNDERFRKKCLSENLKETDLFSLWKGGWRCEFVTAIQYQHGDGQSGK